ncbi:hypothetical protein PCANC_02614 [Puccinia coronata f. sp. avenae]|uniref:Uncharacterized protein n=1 Tax=Puccinia coronata f. sp. avenae TaxID=200324 RepID=A0A2N5W5H7_9BASI|nr:hypothetical protein PCANC_02614 [Puccinia coronata f. sp. avenae]
MNTQQLPPRPPEPIQRPIRLINDLDLCYELGGHFNQFLKRYEQAASFFGCSKYEMAIQIGRFMKTEDLLKELEYMDRYDKADWKRLQAEMIGLWGEFEKPLLLYTTQDLLKLKEEVVSQGGITNYQKFKDYLAEFLEILDYLVRTEQLGRKQEATCLFVQSFTPAIQKKITRNLSINRKLLQHPDGTWKNPLWNSTTTAAENEIRLEEEQFHKSRLEEQLMDTEQSQAKYHSQPLDQEDFPREPSMGNNTKSENNEATAVNLSELEVNSTKPEEKISEPVEKPENLVLTPEWRAQALEMMDAPMEMKHIVIEIPELNNMEIPEPDDMEITELEDVESDLDNMEPEPEDGEPELDNADPERFVERVPNQPEDPKFSTSPSNWIQQIIKTKRKIFNKQLFKPHLDWERFQFLKDLRQGYRRLFSTIKRAVAKRARSISQTIPQLSKSTLIISSSQSSIQHTQNARRATTDSPQHLKNTNSTIQKVWDPGRLRFFKSRLPRHHNTGGPNSKTRKNNLIKFKKKRKKKNPTIKFQESKQSNYLGNPVKIQHAPGHETKLFKNNPKININKQISNIKIEFKQTNKSKSSQSISLGYSSSRFEKSPYSFFLQNLFLINHKKHKKKKTSNLTQNQF